MVKSTDDTDPRGNKKGSSDASDQSSGPSRPKERARTATGRTPSANNKKSENPRLAPEMNPLYRLLKKVTEEGQMPHFEMYEFKYKDLLQILIKMKALLLKEQSLVRCSLPCVVVGDIHGQFIDLLRVFAKFAGDKDKPGLLTQRYVFLGDYVDRGKHSLEVIVCVFIMKILHPGSVFLLRGNHECKPINRVYGFQGDLLARYDKDDGMALFHMFNEAFTHLPLACLVGESVLCMHGGISPKLTSLEDIAKIPKPLADPNSNELACDLMWADPMIGLKGFKPNAIRGVSIHFGEDVLFTTMKALNVQLIVRGHQMMMNGFNFFASQRLVTVFTAASYYPDKANRGAVMYISDTGRAAFHTLVPHTGGGEKVFLGEHDEANQYDTGYLISVADEKRMLGGSLPRQ